MSNSVERNTPNVTPTKVEITAVDANKNVLPSPSSTVSSTNRVTSAENHSANTSIGKHEASTRGAMIESLLIISFVRRFVELRLSPACGNVE